MSLPPISAHAKLDQALHSLNSNFVEFCHLVDQFESELDINSTRYNVSPEIQYKFESLIKVINQLGSKIQTGNFFKSNQIPNPSFYKRIFQISHCLICESSQFQRVMFTLDGLPEARKFYWRDLAQGVRRDDREWSGEDFSSPLGSWKFVGFYYENKPDQGQKRQKLDRNAMISLRSGAHTVLSFCDRATLANLSSASYPFKMVVKSETEVRERLYTDILNQAERVLREAEIDLDVESHEGFDHENDYDPEYQTSWEGLKQECASSENREEVYENILTYFSDIADILQKNGKIEKLLKLQEFISDLSLTPDMRDCLARAIKYSGSDLVTFSIPHEEFVQLSENSSNHDFMKLYGEHYEKFTPSERFSNLERWAPFSSHDQPAELLLAALNHFEKIDKTDFVFERVRLKVFISIVQKKHTPETLHKALSIATRKFNGLDRQMALYAIFALHLSPAILSQITHFIHSDLYFNVEDKGQILLALIKCQGAFISLENSLEIVAQIQDETERRLAFVLLLQDQREFTQETMTRALEIAGTFSGKNSDIVGMTMKLRPLLIALFQRPSIELVVSIKALLKEYPGDQGFTQYSIAMKMVRIKEYGLAQDFMQEIESKPKRRQLLLSIPPEHRRK